MLLKRLPTLLLICSALLLGSCTGAPLVTVCVSDPEAGGFECNRNGEQSFLPYSDSANFTALSPDDLDKLTTYVKRKISNCKK